VKKGEERLRLNVTRGHTREDMDRALGLLETYGNAFFVIGPDKDTPLDPLPGAG
jgi:glycine C-acetyltransferase